MPVDAAVAHIERTGNVHHRCLRQSEPAQHVLGGFENSLRSQNDDFVHACTVSLSGIAIRAAEQRGSSPASSIPAASSAEA